MIHSSTQIKDQPTLVVAAILIRNNTALISQRKNSSHLPGFWEFPGGKIEPGEEPRDALVRELEEELGIDAIIGDIIEVTFFRYPQKNVLLLFYEAKLSETSPEPFALDVADFRWVTFDELSNLTFPPADVDALRKTLKLLKST